MSRPRRGAAPAAVLFLDVGGSSVKASVVGSDGLVAVQTEVLSTVRPDERTAEFDPDAWWDACVTVVRRAVAAAGPREWLAVVPASLRQGIVLLAADGATLGPGILNSDRRGAHALRQLRDVPGLVSLTGHWLAPELTLPKLLTLAKVEPVRWAATARVLFLHDWLRWRLSGEQVSEISYVCAGQLADVAARTWATDLLTDLGLGTGWCAPVVEAGTRVGPLTDAALGLPLGVPVHAGCGDTQLAAAGAGGLADGVITVVVGSSTPVIAATAAPLHDPQESTWVSTHATAALWAAETNCGYPGAMAGWARGVGVTDSPSGVPGAGGVTALTATPEWSERAWSHRPPMSLSGLTPASTGADIAQALAEAHAFAVRGNVEGLARALGAPAREVVLTGGAGAVELAPLVATVLGRPVALAAGTAAAAAWALVTGSQTVSPPPQQVEAGDPGPYEAPYARWRAAYEAVLRP